MKIIACANGHLYDPDKYKDCPYCKNTVNNSSSLINEFPPINKSEQESSPTLFTSKCKLGHIWRGKSDRDFYCRTCMNLFYEAPELRMLRSKLDECNDIYSEYSVLLMFLKAIMSPDEFEKGKRFEENPTGIIVEKKDTDLLKVKIIQYVIMSKRLNKYNNLAAFYRDFQQDLQKNPGRESMTSYITQHKLLNEIQKAAEAADVEMDQLLANEMNKVNDILRKKFGIVFHNDY